MVVDAHVRVCVFAYAGVCVRGGLTARKETLMASPPIPLQGLTSKDRAFPLSFPHPHCSISRRSPYITAERVLI